MTLNLDLRLAILPYSKKVKIFLICDFNKTKVFWHIMWHFIQLFTEKRKQTTKTKTGFAQAWKVQSNLGYPNAGYPKLLGYSKAMDSPEFFLYYLLQ